MTSAQSTLIDASAPTVSLRRRRRELARLGLGALGVVYGDIGTSPLYAIRECVTGHHGVAATTANVLGVLSLVFWSLIAVVTLKYLVFVLRADNEGEGGVLALLALALAKRHRRWLVVLGLFGAALLYGDGMITPAISVLSALEGLGVATTAFQPLVVPLTCAVLVALFAVQRRGTAGIAAVFGPITVVWFVSLAMLGLPWVARQPAVLGAINPWHAAGFLVHHGRQGFLVLGSVFLCVTGGEALYADMGHFGRRAIRTAWYAVVLPSLLLNYFGQGALLIERPHAANPFYDMVPPTLLYPMVTLATLSTIVASQALISGAFSLTRQAVAMGYWPRVTVVHTSGRTEGQIFIPEINDLLMFACLALVLGFRSSDALANAYGIAVTGTMGITSLLFYFVCRDRWGWSRLRAGSVLAVFAVFDGAFLASNLAKVHQGGWVPLAVATGVFCVMSTWKRGRSILAERLSGAVLPLSAFVADVALAKPIRVPGTAVFMSSGRRGTPHVLLHHLKHNKTLHRHVVVLSIVTDGVPETPAPERLRVKSFGEGVWAVTAHYGFMESPEVPALLVELRGRGVPIDRDDVSYFLGRETLLCVDGNELARWRKRLFAFLTRNARPATDFFGLPPNRVVELGVQVEL